MNTESIVRDTSIGSSQIAGTIVETHLQMAMGCAICLLLQLEELIVLQFVS
jgi:hypothetical protein